MVLSDLETGGSATVKLVLEQMPGDLIARRLRDLGFVEGETVRLLTRGPIGGDPLLVQVGFTRFAMRRNEAARVHLHARDA